jgi:hypothetical protein
MNHEVPQPTTATFSPGAGRTPVSDGASATAVAQHSGWLAISRSVAVVVGMVLIGISFGLRNPTLHWSIPLLQTSGTD